jgi:hypothetical protein
MLRTLLSLVLFITALLHCYGQGTKAVVRGGITGFVGTEDQQPAIDAQVCLETQSGNTTSSTCRWSVGSDGHFTIDQLPIGSFQVFAIDQGLGYSIENQRPGQRVQITSNQPWQDITIQMRKPGGIVSGSITDSLTGKPIRPAWISYSGLDCNASGSTSRINESGAFDLTVPPNCDLVVMVTADGYRGWVFADPANPSRPVLNLAAGQRKHLDIRLEPVQTGSQS